MAYTDIDKPTDYFNTKLYTGNGSSQSISSVGFQPDLVWLKNRQDTDRHCLFDNVRGVEKVIFSHLTDAEQSTNLYGTLTSFDSDGFSLLNGSTSAERTNVNGENYVSWNWLASNTTASNTDGSITSTVSANTTSGFSIVSYTGTGANATVGHGLGVAPKMIIIKNRSTAGSNWPVFHETQGGTKIQWLNLANSTATESGWWNNTDPTSSVFSIGTQNDLNKSSDNIIAYCFAEKKGFSKFGSYTGNGNADGTFVYTGFKPAFVLYKQSSSAGNQWEMRDNLRDVTFNPTDKALAPDLSNAEFTTDPIDLLSNGFKFRGGNNQDNGSGSTYIYMCFAESPFTTSTRIPTTPR